MNLTESAYLLTPDECMREAQRQFAMAEIADAFLAWAYERGGWFLLLVHAERIGGVDLPAQDQPKGPK
jgi:hypothetical protein